MSSCPPIGPEIALIDIPSTTIRDRFVLNAKFSEGISTLLVNGMPVELGYCDDTEFCDFYLFEPGENEYTIEVVDYAGNSTSRTFSIIRIND